MDRLRQLVSTDDPQFGFVLGKGTTDTIFVVRQLQEKYLPKRNSTWLLFTWRILLMECLEGSSGGR